MRIHLAFMAWGYAGCEGWRLTYLKQLILKTDLLAGFADCRLNNYRQLSTTDILAPVTMKNAAKCDT